MGMLGKTSKSGFTNKNQWSIPGYVSTEKSRKATIESNKNRIWTAESRAKHSASMKKAVENNPESYSSSNRGRTKQIIYNGVKFQGSWELEFYKWCERNDVKCQRCTEGFRYEWNGLRTYFPDFYLPDSNIYVEVKGYKTERDTAKWEQFPKQLLIIEKKDILAIVQNKYILVI